MLAILDLATTVPFNFDFAVGGPTVDIADMPPRPHTDSLLELHRPKRVARVPLLTPLKDSTREWVSEFLFNMF